MTGFVWPDLSLSFSFLLFLPVGPSFLLLKRPISLQSLINESFLAIPSPGAFSASTVPADSLLTMRPVWPPTRPPPDAMEAILQTHQFFHPRHARQAQQILDQKLLGMEKLDMLLELICLPSSVEAPSTPTRVAGSLGDALGVFASLVSLYNRLVKQIAATPPLEDARPVVDAPAPKRFRDAEIVGPIPRLGAALAGLRFQTGSQPPEHAGMPAPATSRHSNSASSQALLRDDMDAAGPFLPSPRAPPETVVVDFLVNFIAALAIQIQPFGRKPVSVADALEQNYRFGPAPTPGSSPTPSFLARVDGGIPCCKPLVDGELFVAFEVKRSRRAPDDVQIRAQETMEHCAIIWERHSSEPVSGSYYIGG